MMNGGVADRLRSRDISGKIKEEEEEEGRKMNKYNEDVDVDDDDEEEEDDDDDEEEEERRNTKVKKRSASTAVSEKEDKRRKWPINLEKEDVRVLDEKAKNKGEKRIHGGNDKAKYRKAPTPTFVREKSKKSSTNSHGREHKIQNGDHDKDKRRSKSLPFNKNKDSSKEKSRKMSSTHNAEKKLHSCEHQKNKRENMHSNSKKTILSSHNGEHKKLTYDYCKHKGQSEPHPFNNNEMQKNEIKKKKKNTPLDLSKENKTQMIINNKKESKRKSTTEIFSKEKKMRTKDKDEKAWSGDRWKLKNTTVGYNKEQKVQSGHKEERNVTIAFIKIVYNENFKEFLLIPSTIAPKLKDLTNHHVNIEDSERNISWVRLSKVDGSLAFHEGWNNFVSDHSIKLGDFLLFEYTPRSQFSVRVFGMDSCERVCFSVERQGGKKQKGCHAPDEMETAAKSVNAVSGARCMAGNSKEDPSRVVSWVEHGSSIAPYEKNIDLANGKHTRNDILQTWTKGTKSSELILIADDEAPLTQENDATEKLKTLHAASDTNFVTANTEEDPKGVGSGALCGPSVALDNIEGSLAIGECKTNFLSSSMEKTVRSERSSVALDNIEGSLAIGEFKTNFISSSIEKAVRSEIIPVIDTDPLAQNDDAVELTIFPLHIENTSMVKESEPEIATPAKCTEIQDSDEDLTRKQEGNTVQLECTTAVGKCPTNSKMNTNGNVFSKYEAPEGSPSLEEWKKATVSGRTALDVTGLIKPERPMKPEDKLVGNCSSSKYEAPGGSPSLEKRKKATVSGRTALDAGVIKHERLLNTEDKLVGNCSSSKYEAPGGSPSLEKLKKATVSGRTALDVTGLIKPERSLKTEDKLVGNCSSMGVNCFEHSLQGYDGRAAPDGTVPIRPEKRLKTDDQLVGNCSATGVNLVQQSSPGYAGAHSCVQQTPDKISKSIPIKTGKLLKFEDKLVGNCSSMGVNSLEQSLQGYAGRAALDVTGLIRPENRLKSDGKLVGNCSATGVNPAGQWSRGYAGTQSGVQQTPGEISKHMHIKTEIDLLVKGEGPTVQLKTKMEQFEPMGSISCRQQLSNIPVCADHAVARLPEHRSFNQEESKASHHVTPADLLPVKVEVSELDDHSVLKTNLHFCISSTTQTWLELPSSLSHAHRRRGRRDQNIVMLKDPMRRLWPMFYHEHPLFVGFTRGWKPFVTANKLKTGDVCVLLKDLDEAELVYHVQITRK